MGNDNGSSLKIDRQLHVDKFPAISVAFEDFPGRYHAVFAELRESDR